MLFLLITVFGIFGHSSNSFSVPHDNFSVKIVGGHNISIQEAPYQASLDYKGGYFCGASIISPIYVVTAAHCTKGENVENLSVRAGTSVSSSGGQIATIDKIYNHPNFDEQTFDYNIALLKLSTEFKFGSTVAPLALPSPNQSWASGTEVLVTGWGALSETANSLSFNLQGVSVNLIDQITCRNDYQNFLTITESMFCAGVSRGGKDACSADWGSPLQADGVLVGVVSQGNGCGHAEFPGVYTNVTVVREFIKEVTGL